MGGLRFYSYVNLNLALTRWGKIINEEYLNLIGIL